MRREPEYLNVDHCKQIMEQDLMIARDGSKSFYYNPWHDEYRIKQNGVVTHADCDVDEMLNTYNGLDAE